MTHPLRHVALSLIAALLAAAPAVGQTKPAKLVAPKTDPDKIYDAVTEPAIPVVGMQGYAQYLDDHLNYPTRALERRVQGTDSVQFIVEKNGTTSNFVLTHGFDPECDAEALRVVRAAPKWKPAKHRGQVVRQRVTIPITFALPAAGTAALRSDSATVPAPTVTPSAPSPTVITTSPPATTTTATTGTTAGGLKVVQPEKAAEAPGGTDAFFAWIQQNIRYPERARKMNVQGKIRVEFMVEADGSLSNVKLLNRLGSGLDEEALRLIQSSPKWQPATYQGKPIRQKMVLPVIFQL